MHRLTDEAVQEVRAMMPQHNLVSPASHGLMYMPSHEGVLGLYMLTGTGKSTDKSFKTDADVLKTFDAGEVSETDIVTLAGKRTTPGRVIAAKALPDGEWRDKVLHDFKFRLDATGIRDVLKTYSRQPAVYTDVVDKLKRTGFNSATTMGWSVGLKDLIVGHDLRDRILKKADALAAKVPKGKTRDQKLIGIYTDATKEIETEFGKVMDASGNRAYLQLKAGAGMKWDQLRQIVAAPMLKTGYEGTIPIPVRTSYAEGLDSGEFWLDANGARKGMYDKTQEVSIPGAINKQLANVASDLVITKRDCGAKEGVSMPVDGQVLDRVLADDVKMRGHTIPRGTLITPSVLAQMRTGLRNKSVIVRSPLKHIGSGMCQNDYGAGPDGRFPPVGTNVGLIATSAFGERGVQLALKQFHTAGTPTKNVLSAMGRVKQLVRMPETIPDSATLATVNGTVSSVDKDPAGGHAVMVTRDSGSTVRHYVPHGLDVTVTKGEKVRAGRPLSAGVINPRELLPLAGLGAVQNYVTDELYQLYKPEGIRHIHAEMLTHALTGLAKVVDPGDHPDLLPSDTLSSRAIQAWNVDNPGKRPVTYEPVLKSVELLPLEQTEDVLARLAYRRPGDTLIQAAAEGLSSELHGTAPMPGASYGAEFGRPPAGRGPY